MNNTLNLKYFEDDKIQAVEMPYKDNKYSMMIILPKTTSSVNEIEKLISYDYYIKICNSSKYENVVVSIPKFEITSEFNLKKILTGLGMIKSFSDDADFSGMTGASDLKIAHVIHKAFVDVSEKGTEAAAATVVEIKMIKSAKIEVAKIFNADHSFSFFIKDNDSNSILFMGNIYEPNK
jgi:serpin B